MKEHKRVRGRQGGLDGHGVRTLGPREGEVALTAVRRAPVDPEGGEAALAAVRCAPGALHVHVFKGDFRCCQGGRRVCVGWCVPCIASTLHLGRKRVRACARIGAGVGAAFHIGLDSPFSPVLLRTKPRVVGVCQQPLYKIIVYTRARTG